MSFIQNLGTTEALKVTKEQAKKRIVKYADSKTKQINAPKGTPNADLGYFAEKVNNKNDVTIKGYEIDHDLSNQDRIVYHNPTNNDTVVAFHESRTDFDPRHSGFRDTMRDWGTNILLSSDIKRSSRYKHSLQTTQAAIDKYGKDNVRVTGFSQGGFMSELMSEQLGVTGASYSASWNEGKIQRWKNAKKNPLEKNFQIYGDSADLIFHRNNALKNNPELAKNIHTETNWRSIAKHVFEGAMLAGGAVASLVLGPEVELGAVAAVGALEGGAAIEGGIALSEGAAAVSEGLAAASETTPLLEGATTAAESSGITSAAESVGVAAEDATETTGLISGTETGSMGDGLRGSGNARVGRLVNSLRNTGNSQLGDIAERIYTNPNAHRLGDIVDSGANIYQKGKKVAAAISAGYGVVEPIVNITKDSHKMNRYDFSAPDSQTPHQQVQSQIQQDHTNVVEAHSKLKEYYKTHGRKPQTLRPDQKPLLEQIQSGNLTTGQAAASFPESAAQASAAQTAASITPSNQTPSITPSTQETPQVTSTPAPSANVPQGNPVPQGNTGQQGGLVYDYGQSYTPPVQINRGQNIRPAQQLPDSSDSGRRVSRRKVSTAHHKTRGKGHHKK